MLDLDRRILLDLSNVALQAVTEQTSSLRWTQYGSPLPYSRVASAALRLGLKLRSRSACFEGISQWQLEWKAGSDCSAALMLHRQLHCSVPLACKHKDRLLRKSQQQELQDYQNTKSNKLKEAWLEDTLLKTPPSELQGFPYLCEREYMIGQGKGDLVFTDGQGLYAVIEVKHINLRGSNVAHKQAKVKSQAYKYGQAFRACTKSAVVVLAGFYTEQHANLQWIKLHGQDLHGVQQLAEAVAATTFDTSAGPSTESGVLRTTEDSAKSASFIANTISEVVTLEPEHAARVDTPVLSDEAKMVVGIVAIIGLGVGLRYVTDSRNQRHRRQRQMLEDFAIEICLTFFLATLAVCGLLGLAVLLNWGNLHTECQL